jgi:hypothetical protein
MAVIFSNPSAFNVGLKAESTGVQLTFVVRSHCKSGKGSLERNRPLQKSTAVGRANLINVGHF